MGLGLISCSHNSKENQETVIVEEEIGCLCCEVEYPEDSIALDSIK